MNRRWQAVAPALSCALGASLLLPCGSARAADVTTAECLAASDASLKSGTEHRLRFERAQLLVCASPGCPADVRKECIRRVDEVNAAIPSIVFEVRDGAGNDLSAVRVTMDGETLADRLDGVALTLDPGAHTFAFESPGQPTVVKHFVIRESQKDRREALTLGTPAKPTAGLLLATTQPPSPAQSASADGPIGSRTQKIMAVGAGTMGLAGVGVGTAFGLIAWSKRDSARSTCPNQCSSQEGVNLWRDAKTWGNVSTVAFVVGAVGLGAASVLWLTAKSEPAGAPSAQVGLGLGTVDVSGRW